jgi:hypothetical protein
VASLERAFGKAPPVPEHLLEAEHYKKSDKKMDFQGVEKHLNKSTPEIVEYEQGMSRHAELAQGPRRHHTRLAYDEPMHGFDW